ncbi:tryptophan synthase beta chain 1 [Penicillium brevicompactum]
MGISDKVGQHAATLSYGSPGKLHGARSIVLRQDDGTPAGVSSVAFGLVYPGIGPEIAVLHATGRNSVGTIPGEEVIMRMLWRSRSDWRRSA